MSYDEFRRLFEAPAPGPCPEPGPWDLVMRAVERGEPVEGRVVARLPDGWRVDVFGVAGFLADDAVLTGPALVVGEDVQVRILRADRDVGTLRLYIRPE